MLFNILIFIFYSLNENILVNSQNIKVGTYVLSQKALFDAPSRYAEFVLRALFQAEQFQLKDIIHDYDCDTSYFIWASRSWKQFKIVPGTLKALIMEDGILVSAIIDVTIRVPAQITYKSDWIIFCYTNDICDGQTTLTGQFDLSVKFTAQWAGASGIIISAVPTFKSGSPSIFGCKMPWWDGLFGINVKEILENAVQNQITTVVNNIKEQINIPTKVVPYPGIYFTYQVSDVRFFKSDRILISWNCVVQALQTNSDKTQTLMNFIPKDPEAASTPPPSDWNLDLVNNTFYQLQGLRISTTILEAFFWGAQTIGAFNTSVSTPFLDTEIILNTQFTQPVTGINLKNQLTVFFEFGNVIATCKNTQGNFSNMLDVSFYTLAGNGTVFAFPNKTGIIIQIVNITATGKNVDIKWPKLPFPPSMLESLMRMAIDNIVPRINTFFLNNPLILPKSVAYLIPNPELALINQKGCCGGTHGYLDFRSFCSKTYDPISLWKACGFVSSTPQHRQRLEVPDEEKRITTVRPIHNKSNLFLNYINSSEIYMLRYTSNRCEIQCDKDLNHAFLSYIEIVNPSTCARKVSLKYDLFLAMKINDGVLVGMYCNDSCSVSSCLFKIAELQLNHCYSVYSLIFFTKDSIRLDVANDSVVATSFGQWPACEIAKQTNVLFTSLCPGKQCNEVGLVNNQKVILQTTNPSYILLTNCSNCRICSNCSNCHLYAETHIGTCTNLNSAFFQLFNKEFLPKSFQLNYLVTSPSTNNKSNIITYTLCLAIIFIFVVIIIALWLAIRENLYFKSRNFYLLSSRISIVNSGMYLISNSKTIFKKFCYSVKESAPRKYNDIHKHFSSFLKGVSQYFLNQRRNYLETNGVFSLETLTSLFPTIISILVIVLYFWNSQDPISNFAISAFQQLHISIIRETDAGKMMLALWKKIFERVLLGTCVLNIVYTIVIFLFKMKMIPIFVMFIELVTGFCVIHFPPMFMKFGEIMDFLPDINYTSLLGPTVINDYLESKIKTAFMSITLATFADWNLLWLQGLLSGCTDAIIIFWIISDYHTFRIVLGPMIGISISIIIVVPLCSLISIIFLYQSFGVRIIWFMSWTIWWLISMITLVLIFGITSIKIRYNRCLKKSIFTNAVGWLLFIIYIVTQISVISYAYFGKELAFSFVIWLLPLGSSTSLLLIFLSWKSASKTKEEILETYLRINDEEETNENESLLRLGAHSNADDIHACCNNRVKCTFDLRTALYVTGGICMLVYLFMTFDDYVHHSVLSNILSLFDKGNISLQWPKNGTIFDAAINLYEKARWNQLYCNSSSLIFIFFSITSALFNLNIQLQYPSCVGT